MQLLCFSKICAHNGHCFIQSPQYNYLEPESKMNITKNTSFGKGKQKFDTTGLVAVLTRVLWNTFDFFCKISSIFFFSFGNFMTSVLDKNKTALNLWKYIFRSILLKNFFYKSSDFLCCHIQFFGKAYFIWKVFSL